MKVKSGLIPPYVPQWQRRQEVAAKKQSPSPSMCTSIDQENLNPYERRFQPRRSKVSDRIDQEIREQFASINLQ